MVYCFLYISPANHSTAHGLLDAGIDKVSGYKGAYNEKQTRARLKQAVERHINSEEVIICDSLNYIKGFRSKDV